ncbi:unnamed protein product [Discula destructiva]
MANQSRDEAQIFHDAELIYHYHRMSMALPTTPADAIFCLCSLDVRVAQRAAQLFLDGQGTWLVFSGGSGKLTVDRPLFREDPEAVVFARIARNMGVPEDRIIVEPRSTNTGENVRFTYELLRERGLLAEHGAGGVAVATGQIRSFVLVQKPYMETRTFATFMKQWPGIFTSSGQQAFEFTVTSPQLEFAEYPDEHNPQALVVNIMVGDLIRIKEYPAKGYQIPQDIPDNVWEAGQRLIDAGFTHHLP